MIEIGSEFWKIDNSKLNNNLDFLKIGVDHELLMSGRTAIDFVLNNFEDSIKVVYMPDYCCESMIKPFKDNGYKINYYSADVINNKYVIDENFYCSVFFAMSYFGYSISNMDKYIKIFSKKGIKVIEDITHRFLSDINHCNDSTYLVASLRKWFPIISGGIAISVKERFKIQADEYSINKEFVDIKSKAMNLKKEYIYGNNNNKDEFLDLYNKSNHMIENYRQMKIDDESKDILRNLDINKIKKKRIENCKIIERKLKDNKKVKLLYNYSNGDCPLFVPVILENRDVVRKKMIDNKIYLPVHWPNNDSNNKIYNLELSLINDQRYCKEDIENYINILIKIGGE